MSPLKYSIVIPTRNRPAYLQHSLQTVLFAGRDDYEVLVSDNSDAPLTAECERVVREFEHPAVRYVRPPNPPLAMSRHWEWAIGQTRGNYVTIVGDDDGLLPYSLAAVDSVLQHTNSEVITWDWAVYYWPDYLSHPNRLRIRICDSDAKLAYRSVRSASLMSQVLSLSTAHHALPMIYKSFVSQSIIKRMLPPDGHGLNAQSPDIYSGMLISHFCTTICSISMPLAVGGISGKSNGAASHSNGQADVLKDFLQLNSNQLSTWPDSVPFLPSTACAVAECFVHYRERFGSAALSAGYRPMIYLKWYCQTVLALEATPEVKQEYFDLIQRCYPARSAARAYVTKCRRRVRPQNNAPRSRELSPGCTAAGLVIDTTQFGIQNVADAAQFVAQLFPLDLSGAMELPSRKPIQWREFVPPAWHDAGRSLRDTLTTLRMWARL